MPVVHDNGSGAGRQEGEHRAHTSAGCDQDVCA